MKKFKKILILIVVLAIVVTAIILIANRNNKKVTVNDYTSGELATDNEETLDKNSVTASNDEITATLNKYVKIPTEEDAQKINAGITAVSRNNGSGNIKMTMDSLAREVFDAYGKGDIFILNGDENTPLKEVYIGKIADKYVNSNGELIIESEAPSLDEVFDELNVNAKGLLSEESINHIQLQDGVNLKWVNSLENEFQDVDFWKSEEEYYVNTDRYRIGNESLIGPVQRLDTFELGGNFDFMLDLDFSLEYNFLTGDFDIKKSAEVDADVDAALSLGDFDVEGGFDNAVKRKSIEKEGNRKDSNTITEYHQQDGDMDIYYGKDPKTGAMVLPEDLAPVEVKSSAHDDDVTSLKSVDDFVTSLKNNGDYESKLEFNVNGKIGLEDLGANIRMDYSLFDATKFKDVSLGFSGNLLAEVLVKLESSIEIGGEKTFKDVPYVLKTTGLDKKVFPIAYVDFVGGYIPFGGTYGYINNAPVAAGLMLYMDLNGKVDFCASLDIKYGYGFDVDVQLVKDDAVVNELKTLSTNKKFLFDFRALVNASVRWDILAFSGTLSVCGVSVAELGLIDLYFDLEAQAEYRYVYRYEEKTNLNSSGTTSVTEDDSGSGIKARGFGGFYIDIGRARVKLKVVWLPESRHSKTLNLDYDKALLTIDLFTFGNAIGANKTIPISSFKYDEISATTDEYEIYRDSKGKLVRRTISTGAIATYDLDDFVIICGIDQTFLYVLRKPSNGGSGYDLYRLTIGATEASTGILKKDDTTDMVIARDVADVFLEDDEYIYYTEVDDDTTIKRIKRSDRKITTFCTIDNRQILDMADETSRVFVATIDKSDTLGRIFGYTPYGYYIDKNGDKGYNDVYEGPGLYTEETEYGFSIALSVIGRSFLRRNVSELQIKAQNGATAELSTESGWKATKLGEFAVHHGMNEKNEQISLLGYYKAEDGSFVEVAEVKEDNCLWTSTIGKDGRIYYIDTIIASDGTEKKALCSVSADGGEKTNKTIHKVFEAGEFNVNLHNTGATLMNSTMIFYTYDGDDIHVQYRYDLNK